MRVNIPRSTAMLEQTLLRESNFYARREVLQMSTHWDPIDDCKDQLTEIRQQMAKVESKLNRLTANPFNPDCPTLTPSIDLLGARQELILAKLHNIRNHQKPNDDPVSDDNSDGSAASDDLWGPVTPDESCSLGTPLCHCREDDVHH